MLTRRQHGDPFPLQHNPRDTQVDSPVSGAVDALNRLASGKLDAWQKQQTQKVPTAVQSNIFEHVRSCVARAGPCPAGMTPAKCLGDLLKSKSLYGETPNNLAEYDPEKLKVLQSQMQPKDLLSFLPPHAAPLACHPERFIELKPEEVARKRADGVACPAVPYWDPRLRASEAARVDLILKLSRVGIIAFRRKIKASVGLFCVKKKDPQAIRLVIDARVANFHHKQPPVTRLGGCSNFAEIDLEDLDKRISFCDRHDSEKTGGGWANEADVADAFYQFKLPSVASWFGLDMPRPREFWQTLGVAGMETMFDDAAGCELPTEPGEICYPVINAVPMGWSWALYLANEAIAYQVSLCGGTPGSEMKEKLPVPQLAHFRTVTSNYVDNIAILGWFKEDVTDRSRLVAEGFRSVGIPLVWSHPEPVQTLEMLG